MATTSQEFAAEMKLKLFHAREALIGVERDSADLPLLKYLNYFSRAVSIGQLSFLHVLPASGGKWPFQKEDEEIKEQQRQEVQKAQEALQAKARQNLDPDIAADAAYFVKIGDPLEAFTQLARERKVSLLVIGKSTKTEGGHEIMAKNLIRQEMADLLLVPEKAPANIELIMVPIDFSENSVRALKTALAIKQRLGGKVAVKAINVYQRPNLMAFKLDMTPEQFERNIRANHKTGFEKFIAEELPGYESQIEPILVQNDNPYVAQHILSHALAANASLIILGSKGHSKLERLLLGSTTERLLSLTQSVPVMVVR